MQEYENGAKIPDVAGEEQQCYLTLRQETGIDGGNRPVPDVSGLTVRYVIPSSDVGKKACASAGARAAET